MQKELYGFSEEEYREALREERRRRRRFERRRKLIIQRRIIIGTGIVLLILLIKGISLFVSAITGGGDKAEPAVAGSEIQEGSGEEEEEPKTGLKEPKAVEPILQNPELPTGCEATAAAMLLTAYGYEAEKTEVADALVKEGIETVEDKDYAPHPEVAFIGNPAGESSFGVFPNALAKAAQQIIDGQNGIHTAAPKYGMTEKEILELTDSGIPVCIWASINNSEIKYTGGWYLIKDGEYSDEYFYWPANEHCLVLTGYDSDSVTVCDPLEGECEYPRESFFRHYGQVGCYAMILEEK